MYTGRITKGKGLRPDERWGFVGRTIREFMSSFRATVEDLARWHQQLLKDAHK